MVPSVSRAQSVPFKLTTFEGGEMSLPDLKGKLVVVNFFASWCGPCKIEAPELQGAWSEFRGKGVEFIGVAVDDTEGNAREFVKRFSLTFPAGLDSTGRIMADYKINFIPQTYIIGRDGAVLHVQSGMVDRETLSALITEFNKAPAL